MYAYRNPCGRTGGAAGGDIDFFPTENTHTKNCDPDQKILTRLQILLQGKSPKPACTSEHQKTEHSNREIPLPDKLLFYARRFCKENSYYILTGTGKCMEPRVIQRRYANLLKKCGIPPIKIHALRHQFSCRRVERGFDTKSLSEILGHTSVRTTLDLYVHIQAETKRQYMNQMMGQVI